MWSLWCGLFTLKLRAQLPLPFDRYENEDNGTQQYTSDGKIFTYNMLVIEPIESVQVTTVTFCCCHEYAAKEKEINQ